MTVFTHSDSDRWTASGSNDLHRQLVYEKSVAGSAKCLLCQKPSQADLDLVLANLSRVDERYRAFLAVSEKDPESLEGRWTIRSVSPRGGEGAPVDVDHGAFEASCRLEEAMRHGKSYSGRLQEIGSAQSQWFVSQPSAPVLCYPVTVLDHWCGTLGLVSEAPDHGWNTDDDRLLCATAGFFSAYFERNRSAVEHEEKIKLAGALEMAGVVCHKLNQPMQVILGYASMVTSGDIRDGRQIVDIVKLVEDETRKMGIITKNLMGITRLHDAGTDGQIA